MQENIRLIQSIGKRAKSLLLNMVCRNQVISLKPKKSLRGNVLISYVVEPFLVNKNLPPSSTHTNYWECWQMANTFLELGYGVEVISWTNRTFKPQKKYSFFIDIHSNMERIGPLLKEDCLKILHITGAHWIFQNQAEYRRLLQLQIRRAVSLAPRRIVPASFGIEHANCATFVGNEFTASTFRYAGKPLHRIPISTASTYPYVDSKNWDKARSRFCWLGSSGMVHKGLDLVLEAFAQMPELELTICGPVQDEKDFESAFWKELYETANIKTLGWVNVVTDMRFQQIAKSCLGIIYPSCSEGCAGSVITCMHAGLIPIVSYESGVDVEDFGILLRNCSVPEIKSQVRDLSGMRGSRLEEMSRTAWEFARKYHTRNSFADGYRTFVKDVLGV